MSFAVINKKYYVHVFAWLGSGVQKNLIARWGKFVAVIPGILANWPAEFMVPIYCVSLWMYGEGVKEQEVMIRMNLRD